MHSEYSQHSEYKLSKDTGYVRLLTLPYSYDVLLHFWGGGGGVRVIATQLLTVGSTHEWS